MNLLVRYFSKLRSLTDAFEISNHYRICLRLNAVRYKSRCDFMFGFYGVGDANKDVGGRNPLPKDNTTIPYFAQGMKRKG